MPRALVAGQLQQSLDPEAMPGIRLKESGQTGVIELLPHQGPADGASHVIVPKTHRVGVAPGPLGHLGSRPDPDPGNRSQPGPPRLGRPRGEPLEGASDTAYPLNRVRTTGVNRRA